MARYDNDRQERDRARYQDEFSRGGGHDYDNDGRARGDWNRSASRYSDNDRNDRYDRQGAGQRQQYGRPSGWQRRDDDGYQGGYEDDDFRAQRDPGTFRGYDYLDPRDNWGRGAGRGGTRRDYGRDYRGSQGFGREDRGSLHERDWGDRAADEVKSWFGDDDAERRRDNDKRGRGPKNYQRSDSRIQEDVNDELTDSDRLDASEIEVSVSDREVTLTGTVSSKAEKRWAEDCADRVSGVTHVQNNLRVSSGADQTSTTTGGKLKS
ncbi:BON domain-containing protein [Maritimibacter sp. DP1N21-5]|uniref:BON domain-containing protein n=1 Tax=Maritimibacter sp. DP1N21-5 TaxID=2836867 RepID=UPI001C447416|nr:BON domain-containing protein [Maritimibacter sp. DP1N21-5]MBV7411084.1 BON domain-containing protein [Maritimibacter sp. DP1N21-5]